MLGETVHKQGCFNRPFLFEKVKYSKIVYSNIVDLTLDMSITFPMPKIHLFACQIVTFSFDFGISQLIS